MSRGKLYNVIEEAIRMYVDILRIISNSGNLIYYRPKLNSLTGGNVIATILLGQIIELWFENGKQKFYKFKTRPGKPHRLYKDGESWCEELGISSGMFDTAIKKIGFKFGKNRNALPKEKAYIWYYTDDERVTWYMVNEDLLYRKLAEIYGRGE